MELSPIGPRPSAGPLKIQSRYRAPRSWRVREPCSRRMGGVSRGATEFGCSIEKTIKQQITRVMVGLRAASPECARGLAQPEIEAQFVSFNFPNALIWVVGSIVFSLQHGGCAQAFVAPRAGAWMETIRPPGSPAFADGPEALSPHSCLSRVSPPETSTLPGASSMLSFFTTPSSTSME
jgi:hypothetical protein